VSASSSILPTLGSVPSISANGAANGILWTIDEAAQLRAYDAADLGNQLYRGRVSSSVKFSTPTIANGKVYVGTLNSLEAFGLESEISGRIASVVSAGEFHTGPVAPGSVVSLFGTNLAQRTMAASAPWPKILWGVSVFVNGVAAPVAYVSPTQINAQIPYETAVGRATVNVAAGDRVLPLFELNVQPIAPSLFVDGQNHVIAQNQDGASNGPNHPAAPGTVLTTYLTGQGALNEQIPDGSAAPAALSIIPRAPITAALGGRDAEVINARMAPGMVGVLEVALEVPEVGAGSYFLTVAIGGAPGNSGVVTVGTN
jgi:adhesin/invasin